MTSPPDRQHGILVGLAIALVLSALCWCSFGWVVTR